MKMGALFDTIQICGTGIPRNGCRAWLPSMIHADFRVTGLPGGTAALTGPVTTSPSGPGTGGGFNTNWPLRDRRGCGGPGGWSIYGSQNS